jgi:hypothetical protein
MTIDFETATRYDVDGSWMLSIAVWRTRWGANPSRVVLASLLCLTMISTNAGEIAASKFLVSLQLDDKKYMERQGFYSSTYCIPS